MSSYMMKFKNTETGDIADVLCLDDYFGNHNYGYKFPSGAVLDEESLKNSSWKKAEAESDD